VDAVLRPNENRGPRISGGPGLTQFRQAEIRNPTHQKRSAINANTGKPLPARPKRDDRLGR
jgi:hypothetical protein